MIPCILYIAAWLMFVAAAGEVIGALVVAGLGLLIAFVFTAYRIED